MRLFVLGIVLLAASTASAGAYVEMAQKDFDDASAKPKTNKLWADGGKLRLDMEEGKNSVIFKNQTMYAIDHANKRVSVIDKQTMEQVGAQMKQAQAQMQDRLALMPPEQRAQVEKMMAQHGGMGAMGNAPQPERTFKPTSRTEQVAGKPCAVWEVSENGAKVEEMCVAPMNTVNGGSEVLAALKDLGKMVESISQQMGGGLRDRMAQSWRELDQVKGFPVLTRDFENGKAKREQRLVTSRTEPVPAASFDPPSGYKTEKPQMPGQPPQKTK
jgi:hypothetical protein